MSTEPDLIERARAGEPAAWRELYVGLTGRLTAYLRARPSGDTAADVDDLVMETWLVAAERIADFRGGPDDFTGWVFGIARNHAANARRRTSRRGTEPVDLLEHQTWQAPQPPDIGSTEWVRDLLARLSAREAEVLACMEVVGLDTTTTAQALGMSATAVRVARHRGLSRLRRILAEDQDADRTTSASR